MGLDSSGRYQHSGLSQAAHSACRLGLSFSPCSILLALAPSPRASSWLSFFHSPAFSIPDGPRSESKRVENSQREISFVEHRLVARHPVKL